MTAVSAPAPPVDREWDRLVTVTGFGLPVLVLAVVPAVQYPFWQWTALALATPVATWGAWPIYRDVLADLRRGTVGAEAPAALAAAVAFAWSVWALLFGGAGAATHAHPLELLAPPSTGTAQIYLEVTVLLVLAALALRRFVPATAPTGRRTWAGRWCAPATLCLAGAAAGFWTGADLGGNAVTAGLAVLAVAAPLAVDLAAPVAAAAALRRADELDVRLDASADAAAGAVDVVVLGRSLLCSPPAVGSVALVSGTGELDALAVAAALAAHSPLPQASALLGGATFPPSIAEVAVDGSGTVRASTGARSITLGRPDALDLAVPVELGAPDLVVAWDGQVRAGFTVAAQRHPDAVDAVGALRALGLTPVLLTSATDAEAQELAAGLDIELVLPAAEEAGKVEVVRRLRADGHGVVVVAGPGAAHAAAADLPVTVGGSGTSGLGIPTGTPRAAATVVRLARRLSGVTEGSLAVAFGAALVGLPVAAAGLLHPLLAAGLGPAVTAFVVLNGLRLRGTR
ncbi:hypothetical protein ACQEVB_29275 [Pseudonocardia sp. CA-107938]|uniref:hypothetical protein n=1 Tax=Pseudonocardia sp. CA-107938 TaxID=3240021 RepID=UPI003D8C5CF4